MKNLKTSYLVLPFLAANFLMGPQSFGALTDGKSASSKGSCDLASKFDRLGDAALNSGRSTESLIATCDLSIGATVDGKKVTGKLVVERREEMVAPERAKAKFDRNGSNKTLSKEELNKEVKKEDYVARVSYVATLSFESDSEFNADPVTDRYSKDGLESILPDMKKAFASGVADMQSRHKQELADRKAEEKKKRLADACMVEDDGSRDGKAYDLKGQMECHKGKLVGLSSKDAQAYYSKNMKKTLESMVFSGEASDREEAKGILEGLSSNSVVGLSAKALSTAATRQDQVETIARKILVAGNNSVAKGNAQRELLGLRSQVESEDMMLNMYSSFGNGRNSQSSSVQDAHYYNSLLTSNMKLAFMGQSSLDRQTSMRNGNMSYDIDPSGRLSGGNQNMAMAGQQMPFNQQQSQFNRSGVQQYQPQGQYMQQGGRPYQYAGQNQFSGQMAPQQYIPQSTMGRVRTVQ